jgi:NTE family protein
MTAMLQVRSPDLDRVTGSPPFKPALSIRWKYAGLPGWSAPRWHGRSAAERVMGQAGEKKINLALQGGGSHGAFTWGVLDRLLDDERIAVDGISATSAGSMNGAAFCSGYAVGGRAGAKRALEALWRGIASIAAPQWQQPQTSLHKEVNKFWREYMKAIAPFFAAFQRMSYMVSPYEFNPLNINPLKQVLEDTIDFRVLSSGESTIKLYLSATNVRTGKIKVFEKNELSANAVLASACLPLVFHAVDVAGQHYWDGGFMGNPALFPLIYGCDSPDILVVHINPLERPDVPQSVFEILNRVNEISFNSSLMREMRAIAFVTKLIDDGTLPKAKAKRMYVHSIAADEVLTKLSMVSMMNTDFDFLQGLRDVGRRYAERWLEATWERLGKESTIGIEALYM